jgi:putative redox protein
MPGRLSLTSRSASAVWAPGPLRCDIAVDGFTLPVDEPESVGGTGLAPQPTDLFLASVASCFALALVHSARKQVLELTSVRVQVVGNYSGLRFDAVHLVVDVVGPRPAELDRLVEAAERVCYVSNTLREAVDLTIDVRSDG